MSSKSFSAGISFTTGLPRFVITTVSRLACTSSMTARQWILKEPAAIFFIRKLLNHSHYTMVVILTPDGSSGERCDPRAEGLVGTNQWLCSSFVAIHVSCFVSTGGFGEGRFN